MTPSLRERAVIVKDRVTSVPVVDTLLQTYARADGLRFMRWAAAIALFGYLAVFPLLVLAFIAFGAVLHRHPEVRTNVETFLHDTVPLLFDPQGNEAIDIAEVARATSTAGIVSVIALVLAGLGWVDASIEGVRRMQGAMRRGRNVVVSKLQDVISLLATGTVLLLALLGSIVLQAAGDSALEWIGLSGEKSWLVSVFAPVVSAFLLWLVLVTLYQGAWFSRPHREWRQSALGALWASVILVLLMQFSLLVVGRTLTNPVYGTLAIAAALLLFLYLASSVMLYFAAWVAVKEGAPPTQEQIAYAARNQGSRDIQLPVAGVTDPPRNDDASEATIHRQ